MADHDDEIENAKAIMDDFTHESNEIDKRLLEKVMRGEIDVIEMTRQAAIAEMNMIPDFMDPNDLQMGAVFSIVWRSILNKKSKEEMLQMFIDVWDMAEQHEKYAHLKGGMA